MPRLRRIGWLSLLLLLRVVGPVPAGAVETTGQVKVVVADESGSKLLGARVILAGPELMGTRTVTTNYKGEVWVPNVPPGVYQVRVELADYQTQVVEEVRVTIGGTAPVDVVLKPFQAATAVEVRIARPTLDVESSAVGGTLTKEFLEDVPSDRSYQRIVQFTPGVTGGSNPNVMGGASQENAWLLDGTNISDPVTGTFSMNFNYDSIQEVQVLTGLYQAEYGQALGGIINVVTESGSNEFDARVGVEYENGEISPRRDAIYEPNGEEIESSEYDALDENVSISIATGGPIVKDRVWYHGSYSFDRTRHTEMGVEAPRLYRGHNLFAKITAMPHYAHRFTLTGLGSPATIDNQRQSNRVLPEAERRQAQG
ncbi:MAG: TonB-dependent receptor, partial [Myxococcota bacterium]|nr:TonB-dependent receptor [Myxococcota bacterium]